MSDLAESPIHISMKRAGLTPISRVREASGRAPNIRSAWSPLDTLYQTPYAADLAVSLDGQDLAETVSLNFAESASLEQGLFSGEWRHFVVALDMESLSCSVAVDGQPILDSVPLIQLPFVSDRPEVEISYAEGSPARAWIDNLELMYQDNSQALAGTGGTVLKPVIRDSFDRYATGVFPAPGGWLSGVISREETGDLSLALAGQTTGQIADQEAVPQDLMIAKIDESERVSPTRSFRFEPIESFSFKVSKMLQLPDRLPYDMSTANFSIISHEMKLALLRERIDAERERDGAASSGANAQEGIIPTNPQGGSSPAMSALTSTRAGSYYIYAFDGRLLAEYDIYGTCLKDYVYMGSRLVAEYNPATSAYHYYAQDQISSTRIVTDDTGAVVYAAAHDPYGGIQKVWVDAFDPKRKFSDKERDAESGLDYFGARYFNSLRYRFITVDPIFNKAGCIAIPQLQNLYAYCRNNPITYMDPYGLECYVFYDPYNFTGQALAERDRLKEKYPDQEVILVSITSEAEFQKRWGSMVDPVEVTLIFHSGSGDNSMTVVSIRSENYEYLTAHPSGRTPLGWSATCIGDLEKKTFKELNYIFAAPAILKC